MVITGRQGRACYWVASWPAWRSPTLPVLGWAVYNITQYITLLLQVHALAYPLGSHFGVAHGLANSLMLPHVLRFGALNNKHKHNFTLL